jgi:hypothetical protein
MPLAKRFALPNDAIVAFSNDQGCCRNIRSVVISGLEHLASFYWPLMLE